jgi:LuxR family maltose regulon positive regulatory protein
MPLHNGNDRNSKAVPLTQHTLSLAKITIPRLPKIFHREYLYNLLEQSLKFPCVWITGPAGSGKTTLAADFITQRKFPFLWCQLDRGDTDMATFFHYMGLAVQHLSRPDTPPLPVFSAEYTQDIASFSRRFFEALYFRLSPHCIIVLDDYQELAPKSSVNRVICQAMAALPKGISLFILSRETPHGDFSRARANRLITVFGWDHIRLTEEETGAIASLQMHRKLPRTVVPNLHRVVGGWVAGLILILNSGSVKSFLKGEIPYERHPEIYDYLTNEVFDSMDPDTQDLLSKTALFPHMTGPMAESLTGLPHGERVFSFLHQKHLFIEKRVDRQNSYRYHPLFRNFLLARLEKAYSEANLAGLRYRAALILDEAGQHEAAISLLCHARYWEDAARMMENHAASLLSQGRTGPLGEWLDQLPSVWLDKCPWLNYWKGACHLSFDPSAARACFIKAFARFQILQDRKGMFLAWSGIVESVFYAFEGFSLLDHWIEVFEELIQKSPFFPSEEIEARVVFGIFSALTFRQPHHPQMRLWADRALKLADATHNARAKAYAYTQLIFYHMMMGNHGTAAAIVQAAKQLNPDAQKDPLVKIDLFAVKASYLQNLHRHDDCLKTVFEALKYAAETGVHIMDQMFLGWGAWSSISANDLKTAADLLEKLGSEYGPLRPHENSLYHFLRSQEAVAHGDFQKAVQHGELSLSILEDLGIPINICIVHLSMAQAMHGLERIEEAEQHLARAFRLATKMGSRMLRFSVLLLKATFTLDRGDEASALSEIRNALALGKENGFFNSMIGRPRHISRICAKALDAEIEVDYVRNFIQARGLIPEKPHLVSERWPWPIRVITLGGFELTIHGKPFSYSGRAPKKTLDLLKLLIASGKKGIHKTPIQDALWPEMDGDRAHNIFSTSLHRLRKILGSEKAISFTLGRVALNENYCWVDIFYFRENLEQANLALKMGEIDSENSVQMMEKAVSIYQGVFLPDDDEPWAIPTRQRLAMEFIQCVEKLGGYYEETGQLEEATRCYLRGLKIDPLTEEFYRRLMGCYLKAGNLSEAKRTFIQCRETLSKVLGVAPSTETETLFAGI